MQREDVDFAVFFLCSNDRVRSNLKKTLEILENECPTTLLNLLDVRDDNVFFSKRSVIAGVKNELSRRDFETKRIESYSSEERLMKYDDEVDYTIRVVTANEFQNETCNMCVNKNVSNVVVVWVMEDKRRDDRFSEVVEYNEAYAELYRKKFVFKNIVKHEYVLYVNIKSEKPILNDPTGLYLKERTNDAFKYALSFDINVLLDDSTISSILFLKVVFLMLNHAIEKTRWEKKRDFAVSLFYPVEYDDDDDDDDRKVDGCLSCIIYFFTMCFVVP